MPPILQRLACLAAALCAGCASLSPPPPVDVLPTAPPALPATSSAGRPANGSLFHPARYRPVFEDERARFVGDTVTIQIVENVTASQTSSSTVNRKSDLSAGVTAFPYSSASSLSKLSLGANSANDFEGKGGTQSANTFSGAITATVVDVLPNGHLVVTGEKQIGVNQNVDVLKFSGTVNPRSLQPGSIVASTQVANVRVESRGRGQQQEAQVIGWLSRFFLSVLPF
ncbi:flagellar basal body L-ring protein FlgH [Ramlibacter sp. H39-3-26]|jgi:flagellar L-ring protein precursor FlgH|uniref:flagellar basal body L-ring protein FlgH n=1 Tax=Curvibacter soli TaxID=3031331 RepID=UPI0023D98773|nr:flagellar basal body L-ring protein FlgH [Ramlibacter sp. H39-3-26]MDF1485806.1 flagellar basal body L-ring protein FlgH [Ramlibacter sp. H39-3-26]